MGERVLVWRIENAAKKGMYDVSRTAHHEMGGGKRHPGPNGYGSSVDREIANVWDAMPWREQQKWFFGFESLEQMKRWVHTRQLRRTLHEEGLLLNCYSVPAEHVHTSKHQAIFRRWRARKVESRRVDYDCQLAG